MRSTCLYVSTRHCRHFRQRGARLLLAVSLLGISPCVSAFAGASVLSDVQQRIERKADFRWGTPETQKIYGLDLHTSQFTSATTLSESAHQLAQTGMFSGMLLAPSKIQLSGISADKHWLAQLHASKNGTEGYVSVFHVLPDVASQQALRTKKLNLSLDAANLWLEHTFPLGDRQASQKVLHIQIQSERLLAYLQRKLRGDGWQRDLPLFLSVGGASWSKQEEKLTLLPEDMGGGSVLYHSYFQPRQKER